MHLDNNYWYIYLQVVFNQSVVSMHQHYTNWSYEDKLKVIWILAESNIDDSIRDRITTELLEGSQYSHRLEAGSSELHWRQLEGHTSETITCCFEINLFQPVNKILMPSVITVCILAEQSWRRFSHLPHLVGVKEEKKNTNNVTVNICFANESKQQQKSDKKIK